MYSENVELVQATMEHINTRSNLTIRRLQTEIRDAERFLLLSQVYENLERFMENRDVESYQSQKNSILRLQLTPDEPFYSKIDSAMKQLEMLFNANKRMLSFNFLFKLSLQ